MMLDRGNCSTWLLLRSGKNDGGSNTRSFTWRVHLRQMRNENKRPVVIFISRHFHLD